MKQLDDCLQKKHGAKKFPVVEAGLEPRQAIEWIAMILNGMEWNGLNRMEQNGFAGRTMSRVGERRGGTATAAA